MDIVLNDAVLKVFKNGDIMRKMRGRGGYWKEVANTDNNGAGYNFIRCGGKLYQRHRIIGYCYLGLDINDVKQEIDHIDHDKLNNDIMNLRIVTHQENMFNKNNTKGYSWHKKTRKWHAEIRGNGKKISLGYWDTEEEARNAYLEAKEKYHIFRNA